MEYLSIYLLIKTKGFSQNVYLESLSLKSDVVKTVTWLILCVVVACVVMTITPLFFTIVGAGVAVTSDLIYVCGGYDGTDHLASVECFNIHTQHWTQLQNMVVPRCYVGACVLRGYLYVVAG